MNPQVSEPEKDEFAASALRIAREQLGADIASVDALAGGFFSRAYAFSAAGRAYVIRVNSAEHAPESFAKDDYAWRHFGSPGLPIPEVVATGRQGDLYFAISARARGQSLSLFSAAERRELLPALLDTLEALGAVDVSGSRGFGNWNGDGDGEHESWHAFLAAAIDDHAEGYYKHWHRLFRDSFLERELYEAVYRRMVALAAGLSERRGLIHNDYQFENVIADGARITGVIDWANALYGDPLYDVAWLSWITLHPGWWFDDGEELLRARFGAGPDFETRLACYQCHVGLDHLRFYAKNDRRADYERCRAWLLALLDRTAI